MRKCRACHEICTSPCESAVPATQVNPCETSALPCQWARAPSMVRDCPNALRTRSGRTPNALRPGAANRLASSSPETPIHARGHAFCRFLTPTTHARIFLVRLFLLFICLSESWLSISCRNTEVPSKLPLMIPLCGRVKGYPLVRVDCAGNGACVQCIDATCVSGYSPFDPIANLPSSDMSSSCERILSAFTDDWLSGLDDSSALKISQGSVLISCLKSL